MKRVYSYVDPVLKPIEKKRLTKMEDEWWSRYPLEKQLPVVSFWHATASIHEYEQSCTVDTTLPKIGKAI